MVPPVAFERLTKKVSSGSKLVSPLSVTENVCDAWSAAKFSVPAFAR